MRRFLTLFLIAALGLAGCSGSAGGSPAAQPIPTTAPSLSIAAQRTQAQAAMVAANGVELASLLAAAVELVPFWSGTVVPPKGCHNGVEITVKILGPETATITIDAFYDAKCTTKLAHAVINTLLFPGGNFSFTGTSTFYDTSGTAVAYGAFSNKGMLVPSNSQLTLTGTLSQTPTGPAFLSFGLSCTLAASNSCGFGGVASLAPVGQSLGVTATIGGFVGSGSSNGTVQLSAYTGALGALKLSQGSGNAWVIRGGKAVTSQSGTFKESVDALAFDVTGTMAISDAKANSAATLSFGSKTGIARGVVRMIRPSLAQSTFSTDARGSGTIQYSDGSSADIIFFLIES